jgi:hypothetical protein
MKERCTPERKQFYRLPTEPREVTDDQELWAKSWNDLGTSVSRLFPGYHLAGMDPGILLHPDDYKGDSISLPLHACLILLKTVKRNECEIDHAEWHQRWGWDADCGKKDE